MALKSEWLNYVDLIVITKCWACSFLDFLQSCATVESLL
jgi:hypothetical protein